MIEDVISHAHSEVWPRGAFLHQGSQPARSAVRKVFPRPLSEVISGDLEPRLPETSSVAEKQSSMSLTTDLVSTLTSTQIIPDVLPASFSESFTPTVLFTVVYPTGVETDLGNTVLRSKVLEEPEIRITPLGAIPGLASATAEGGVSDREVRYTLAMVDPDAPSRTEPKYRQWRHWVITGLQIPNVQPENAAEVVYALKTKPATTPYWPPGPPPGSDLHRYTFLLFEEPERGITIPPGAAEYGTKLEERRSWNVVKFADANELKLVGANFFLCQE